MPSFNAVSNDDTKLVLLTSKFSGSHKLSLAELHVREIRSFNSAKSFTLNIELLAIPGKSNEAFTFSKFSRIIRSLFTSEINLKKAREIAISKKILVNDDFRKVNSRSDWKVIVKEISVDLLKLAVESVFSKFDKVALLYTLLVRITTYDLSDLLNSYSRKTCFIGCNLSLYVHNRCVMVCFEDETSRVTAVDFIPVFKSCKQSGHVSINCVVGENHGGHSKWVVNSQNWVCLANIYKKKQALIICPVSFGGKTWAQVASGFSSFVVSSFPFGTGLFFGAKFFLGIMSSLYVSASFGVSGLYDFLASLKHFLELLANQVSSVMKKLNFVKLVPLSFVSYVLFSAVLISLALSLNSNIVLNSVLVLSVLSFSAVEDNVSGFSLSSSKVLTTKVGGVTHKNIENIY
ncbi:hypothetical protein G9A89_012795 [Geosiphon pyriformis]|nr:hypothetical protein G9A89_012795 [Geosiphon pyriformis]